MGEPERIPPVASAERCVNAKEAQQVASEYLKTPELFKRQEVDYIDWRTVAEILVRRLITVSAAQRPDVETKMEKGFAALKDELKEVVTQLKTIVPTLGKQTTGKATYASVVGTSTAPRQEAEKKFDAKEARARREIIIKVADEKEAMQLRGKGAEALIRKIGNTSGEAQKAIAAARVLPSGDIAVYANSEADKKTLEEKRDWVKALGI
ncbi:MAG: hypothetical protein MMC33_010456 [Icmadophila ericetorum]|nr:hypothetical protein [Icmadophila ericetorum]